MDESYLRIIRRVTKNMTGYPSLPMMSGHKDGGLNVETPLLHAHKCKLRILLRGLSKGGLTGIHIENLLRMELEKSGAGGLPNQHTNVQVSWGEAGYITSLVQWLDEVGLAIHLPGLMYNSPFAQWVKVKSPNRRIKGANPFMTMEGEMDKPELDGKMIPTRIGQCWEVDGGVFEISNILDYKLEGRTWVGAGKRLSKGGVVTLDKSKNGQIETIDVKTLERRGNLVALDDMPKRVNSKARRARKKLARKPARPLLSLPRYAGQGGLFDGFEFDEVFTDGSWK